MPMKTKGMPIEQIREEIRQRKLQAFDMCVNMLRLSPTELKATGHKEPVDVIRSAARMNEARLQDWEKNNGAEHV